MGREIISLNVSEQMLRYLSNEPVGVRSKVLGLPHADIRKDHFELLSVICPLTFGARYPRKLSLLLGS